MGKGFFAPLSGTTGFSAADDEAQSLRDPGLGETGLWDVWGGPEVEGSTVALVVGVGVGPNAPLCLLCLCLNIEVQISG